MIHPTQVLDAAAAQRDTEDAITEAFAGASPQTLAALCKVFNCMARVYAIELIDAPAPRVPVLQTGIAQVRLLAAMCDGKNRDGDTPLL